MSVNQISDATFQSETSSGTVLVDFWAPWCGPCKMIAPILDELSNEVGDKAKIVKINVDDNPESAAKYNVMSIPTLLVFKDGQVVDQLVGVQPKEKLKAVIEQA
ncbi:thioredoxin [Paenibacillus sp. CGMCC 1.16610]|uniref:Thioredoxin n=2 Tax=Paenibacillus TaxID=44249 RepID=A0ABU6DPS5_9BACL|nr:MULTISPECIES: thioredoxin [Paenibacillus]MBA2942859.1 thioredoxin [Paenibacillus sp. CGMCC 1.16610]MCY9663192.1 thioredoxin [Paenibacillus anseongense]MEB4798831.1 thioredoxin [Paenibacillus chondroitinus]MVQ38344.1 thioredoxin [Paenibacillus anseongense]